MSIPKTLLVLLASVVLIAPPARAADRYQLDESSEYAWLGAGLALSAGGVFGIGRVHSYSAAERASLDATRINGFDRGLMQPYREDHLGDALVFSSFAIPFTLLSRDDVRAESDEFALMWFEAALLNQGIVSVTKALAQRARPFTYDSGCPTALKDGRSARLSFYSGHTAFSAMNTFFTATVFSDYSSDRNAEIAVWGGAVAYSIVTGLCRVETGHHFATDVITGFVVGATIGYLVPALHRSDDADAGASPAPAAPDRTLRIGATFGF